MNRALTQLSEEPGHVVVDGLPVKNLEWEHEAVVGGDGLVHSIGCASIVAKVTRDRLMTRLALRYPGYSWEKNAGYGTASHRAAIKKLGLTPHHRITFGGLQYELDV
jgi:ribonuclease HII